MRCEAAKLAAIFILVEWLFWWLFRDFLRGQNGVGFVFSQSLAQVKFSRETQR